MPNRLMIAIAAGLIAGCAAVEAAPAQPRRIEAVYAAIAGKQALRVRVSSNGCTKKEDFAIEGRRGEVTLRRIRPDRCQSFAQGSTWLDFSYAELGVRRGDFHLANPLTAWTGPGE